MNNQLNKFLSPTKNYFINTARKITAPDENFNEPHGQLIYHSNLWRQNRKTNDT